MIIELPNYIDLDLIEEIKTVVKPHINVNEKLTMYRDGNTVYISAIEALKELDNKLHNLFNKIHHDVVGPRYSPIRFSGDSGYEYHLYNPGDVAHIHVDGEIDPTKNYLRYASVILCLNTPKEGGELIFPKQNKTIKTELGKVIIFPPYGTHTHYTTPSVDSREVIVSWFVYRNVVVNDVTR